MLSDSEEVQGWCRFGMTRMLVVAAERILVVGDEILPQKVVVMARLRPPPQRADAK